MLRLKKAAVQTIAACARAGGNPRRYLEIIRFALSRGSYVNVSSDLIPSAGLPASRPKRTAILVIEEEVLIRLMICDELRKSGFDVLEAKDDGEARAVLDSDCPVDLIVMDVQDRRGAVDDAALADYAHKLRPDLRIIVVSESPAPLPASANVIARHASYELGDVAAWTKEALDAVRSGGAEGATADCSIQSCP
jgi:CheY-like chemotaxis protein